MWDMWGYSIQDIGNTTINPLLGNHVLANQYTGTTCFLEHCAC